MAMRGFMKIGAGLSCAAMAFSTPAFAAAQVAPAVNPWVALSAFGVQGAASAVCAGGTAAATAAQGAPAGCVLPVTDAPPPAPVAEAAPPPPPAAVVPVETGTGIGALPLLLAHAAIVGIGALIASGHNNNDRVNFSPA